MWLLAMQFLTRDSQTGTKLPKPWQLGITCVDRQFRCLPHDQPSHAGTWCAPNMGRRDCEEQMVMFKHTLSHAYECPTKQNYLKVRSTCGSSVNSHSLLENKILVWHCRKRQKTERQPKALAHRTTLNNWKADNEIRRGLYPVGKQYSAACGYWHTGEGFVFPCFFSFSCGSQQNVSMEKKTLEAAQFFFHTLLTASFWSRVRWLVITCIVAFVSNVYWQAVRCILGWGQSILLFFYKYRAVFFIFDPQSSRQLGWCSARANSSVLNRIKFPPGVVDAHGRTNSSHRTG